MSELFEHIVNEISLAGIDKKQKSITKLFPNFYDRVSSVGDKGGVKLNKLEPNVWKFYVHSGTKEGKWYDVNFKIKDILGLLVKYIPQKDMWTKSGDHVDLRKVARAIFFDADVEVECSCPAAQYWGPNFQLTKADAKYGAKEKRPPDIRNPKQHGLLCKHLQALVNVLPFYISTVANWLKKNYKTRITRLEKLAITAKAKGSGGKVSTPVKPTQTVTKTSNKASSTVQGQADISRPSELKKQDKIKDVDKTPVPSKKDVAKKKEDNLKLSPKSRMLLKTEQDEIDTEENEQEHEEGSKKISDKEKKVDKKKLSPKANYLNKQEQEDEEIPDEEEQE